MGKEYVCVCPIFTSESIEFILAWSVVGRLHKKVNQIHRTFN